MALPPEDPDHLWDAHIADDSNVIDMDGMILGSFDPWYS